MDVVLQQRNGTNSSSSRGTDRAEYEKVTKDILFAKDFLPALEAVMRDELAAAQQRVLAWIKRMAWGNYSLYAILDKETGETATQAHLVAQLRLDKGRVSHVVAYLEKRGYLRRDGKKLYPVISPQLGPDPGKVADPATFRLFFAEWRVANSATFERLEAAREAKKVANSTIKEIQKVLDSDYQKWSESTTNGRASLYERKAEKTENNSSSSNGHPQPAQEEPAAAPAAPVFDELQKHGTVTEETAQDLLKKCRQAKPGCTPSEVVEAIQAVAQGFGPAVRKPIALLRSEVPKVIRSRPKPPPVETEESRRDREAAEVLRNPDQFDAESVAWAKARAAGKGVP